MEYLLEKKVGILLDVHVLNDARYEVWLEVKRGKRTVSFKGLFWALRYCEW
jgi:predicted nucleotidyltransferase